VIEGWAILPDLFFGADLPDVDACWLVADEPTPDAAGLHGSRLLPRRVRRGGTDHEVRRAFGTLHAALEHAARTSNGRMIRVNGDEPPDTVCTRVLNAIT
jgi:hypothetical protein